MWYSLQVYNDIIKGYILKEILKKEKINKSYILRIVSNKRRRNFSYIEGKELMEILGLKYGAPRGRVIEVKIKASIY